MIFALLLYKKFTYHKTYEFTSIRVRENFDIDLKSRYYENCIYKIAGMMKHTLLKI